jgi:hypothetical protein
VKFLISPTSARSVQAFGIARDALIERRVDEDFDEFAPVEQFPHHAALGARKRRDVEPCA